MKIMRSILYSLIIGLVAGFFVPEIHAGNQVRNNQKNKFKEIVNSKYFKAGVGIAALLGGCGVIWFLKSIIGNKPNLVLTSENPLVIEKFDIQEIKNLISTEKSVLQDPDVLGYEIQGRGKGPLTAGSHVVGNWKGYGADWHIRVNEDNYLQVTVYYKNHKMACDFLDKMDELQAKLNMSNISRLRHAVDAETLNPF